MSDRDYLYGHVCAHGSMARFCRVCDLEDEENTYVYPNGRRDCRTCNAAACARYRARKAAA
jgi:hypothetical protein